MDTCKNGGACENIPTGFKCRCDLRYKGTFCTEVVRCTNTTCENNGICRNRREGGFLCTCSHLHEGERCERLVRCSANLCKNGGSCYDTSIGFQCTCLRGYSTPICTPATSCSEDPCHNAATCLQTQTGFKCLCPNHFTGVLCETVMDNIALRKPTHQSPDQNVDGSVAVDGLLGQCTSSNRINPWWVVDLQRNYRISEVEIVTCCDNFPKFDILIGLELPSSIAFERYHYCIKEHPRIRNRETKAINCDGPIIGSYLGIRLQAGQQFNQICEVRVFGTAVMNCRMHPCQNGGTCYERKNGFICNCTESFQGPTCTEDCLWWPDGRSYTGSISHSIGLRECMYWNTYRTAFSISNDDFIYDESMAHAGKSCRNLISRLMDRPYCLDDQANVQLCDIPRCDPCSSLPCMHNGTCEIVNRHLYVCKCPPGRHGRICNSGVCDSSPCAFGGTCVPISAVEFSCFCKRGSLGYACTEACRQIHCLRCDVDIGKCDDGHCEEKYYSANDGSCLGCSFWCLRCQVGYKCQPGGCVPGYGLHNERMCETCLVKDCMRCDGDISLCNPGGCYPRYTLTDYNTTCTACRVLNCGSCEENVTHCDPDGCMSGYVISDDRMSCLACRENCLQCDTSLKCKEGGCLLYYYSDHNGDCVFEPRRPPVYNTNVTCPTGQGRIAMVQRCAACVANCERCDQTAPLCDTGGCADGYNVTTSGSCQIICLPNCVQCRNSSVCDSCAVGYKTMVTGECVRDCPKGCASCMINHLYCDPGKCKLDFVYSNETGLCVLLDTHAASSSGSPIEITDTTPRSGASINEEYTDDETVTYTHGDMIASESTMHT